MRQRLIISGLVAVVLLTACATSQFSPEAIRKPGVKRAWITGFFSENMPRNELPLCLSSLPAADLKNRRFVKLHYRHTRIMINEVAELPSGVEAALDDVVEVIPHDCDKGELTIITRKLPGGSL